MENLYKVLFFILFTVIVFNHSEVHATHIKAGEITAERLSSSTLQYRFTLTVYTDSTSLVDDPEATLYFGDGTNQTVKRTTKISVGNKTYKNVYVFDHTYSASGYFIVGYKEVNRNGKILNISNSDNTAFYIETSLSIDPFLGVNNTPVLLVPPIDLAAVGEVYSHNPGAYDPDGDSLSFKFTVPKQEVGMNVFGYKSLNDPSFGAGVKLSLDPVKGDLVWDKPQIEGLYNVAIIIEEWRGGVRIGYIVRDMQIEVKKTQNNPPVLNPPKDTCITAGTVLNKTITAEDPDNHQIKLSSYSGVYGLVNSKAVFVAKEVQPSPASGIFSWTTICDHVNDQPYIVVFKAEDVPVGAEKLVDVKSWAITVTGPSPNGLTVTANNAGINLKWFPYSCPNADKIFIYRKECESSGYVGAPCETGIPEYLGFEKVAEVGATETSYYDDNNGKGLKRGVKYCYMIVAVFDGVVFSHPSEEACAGLDLDVPIITNATVITTDAIKGEIKVTWTKPTPRPLPHGEAYIIKRGVGFNPLNYMVIDTLFSFDDTTYNDQNIDTKNYSYSYKVDFLYNNLNTLKGTSDNASTTWITVAPGDAKAFIEWETNVPWSIEYVTIQRSINKQPWQTVDTIYTEENKGSYIDSKGLKNNSDTVCYYVTTYGRYCDERLENRLLINDSEVACTVPRDSIPPCPPILQVEQPDCYINDYENFLSWVNKIDPACNKDIKGYNIYFAGRQEEELELIGSTVDTFYIHTDSLSLAGCYAVTALNYYGVESEKSNIVCVDACVYYELPNLITPNNDTLNDVFQPFPTPKGVESVQFSVYNRWGKLVFYKDDDIYIKWNGSITDGKVSDGVYFYQAVVKFYRRLRKEDEVKEIKSWLHIIDNTNGITPR
ncbi:MAG TPA: gliding motility-associated C-terminal domain-containing protein [Cytophagaceae bacterium]